MRVIDASVLVLALLDTAAAEAHNVLGSSQLCAPELIDLEVGAALRRHVLRSQLPPRRAAAALQDLRSLPFERVAHRPLLDRCWELRHSLTFYDSAYVALAELREAPLVTCDARLARAPGVRCPVQLLG